MGFFQNQARCLLSSDFWLCHNIPEIRFFLLKVDRLDEVWVICCSQADSVSRTEDFKVRAIASEISNGISRVNVKFEKS